MGKVHPVRRDGELIARAVYCPACDNPHFFATDEHPDRDGPGWTFNGDGEEPTFSPSMLVERPERRCHSHLRDGRWEYLSDSTHELAGETVPVPESETMWGPAAAHQEGEDDDG
jgi:hypothetical protein